jgi:Na+/melibiose symporter-like transporter
MSLNWLSKSRSPSAEAADENLTAYYRQPPFLFFLPFFFHFFLLFSLSSPLFLFFFSSWPYTTKKLPTLAGLLWCGGGQHVGRKMS